MNQVLLDCEMLKSDKFLKLTYKTDLPDEMEVKMLTFLKDLLDEGEERMMAFGMDSNIVYVCFNNDKIDKLIRFSEDLGVLESVEDLSDSVLKQKDYTDGNFEKIFIGENAEYDYMYNDFIDSFLTVDNVLDKINEFGMDSLTSIDHKILKSNI